MFMWHIDVLKVLGFNKNIYYFDIFKYVLKHKSIIFIEHISNSKQIYHFY